MAKVYFHIGGGALSPTLPAQRTTHVYFHFKAHAKKFETTVKRHQAFMFNFSYKNSSSKHLFTA